MAKTRITPAQTNFFWAFLDFSEGNTLEEAQNLLNNLPVNILEKWCNHPSVEAASTPSIAVFKDGIRGLIDTYGEKKLLIDLLKD